MSMHKGITGQAEGGASVKQDKTLADYIERKQDVKRGLTFDEWIKVFVVRDDVKQFMRFAWNAGQENK